MTMHHEQGSRNKLRHGRVLSFWLSLLTLAAVAMGCAASRGVPTDETGRIEYARARFEKQDYTGTILTLQELLAARPGSRYADEAIFLMARAYYEQGDYVEAEERFRRVLREFPESPFAAECSYYLGLALLSQSRPVPLDQSETLAALTQFRSFLSRYPDHKLADRARKHIQEIRTKLAEKAYRNGLLYDRLNAIRAARYYYEKRVLRDYADTPYGPLAMLQLAKSYAKTGDWKESASWARKALQNLNRDDSGLDQQKRRKMIARAQQILDKAIRQDATAAQGVLPASADTTKSSASSDR